MNETRVEYHTELEDLRTDLTKLGALVTETIGRGTGALLDRDLALAQSIIDGDDVIDDFALDIEERCYTVMALQSPMASDLRFVLTTVRMVGELERSADLVVNICKAARRTYDIVFDPEIRGLIEQMGIEATVLTRSAVDCYLDSDVSLATALDDIDDRLDKLQEDCMGAVFKSHSEGRLNLHGAVQLAMIGRYYERIGDHAVNMGERVNYMVTGWLPEKASSARLHVRESDGEKMSVPEGGQTGPASSTGQASSTGETTPAGQASAIGQASAPEQAASTVEGPTVEGES